MRKRGKGLFIFNMAIFEICLLISMSFTVSFILSENLVIGFSHQEEGVSTPLRDTRRTIIDMGEEISRSNTPNPTNTLRGATLSDSKVNTFGVTRGNFILETRGGVNIELSGYREITRTDGGTTYIGIAKDGSEIPDLDRGAIDAFKTSSGEFSQVGGPEYNIPIIGTSISGYFWGNLVQGLFWAVAVAGVIQLIGSLAGLDRDLTNALTSALASGVFVGKLTYGSILEAGIDTRTGFLSPAGITGIAVGALVAFAIFVAMYSKEKKKLVNFQCLPFEPPLGGAKCEECNKDLFRPCSEYRCRSLGQACQLLNAGTNEEKCAWINPKDVNSPTIQPFGDVLKPKDLAYVPDNTIRPPNRGVKIVKGGGDGCIQAFTHLEFGISVNEPAQCKIDYNHTQSFDQMQFYFGGSNYHRYNHTQIMKLPGPDTSTGTADFAPELKNDGSFSLFVRCRDANGNENVDEFVFNFCVDKSPDTTPPVIEGTSIRNNGFVRFNADKVPIELYVNEPVECKWSRESKNYNDMENNLNCFTETFQINTDLNYVCKGNLTGIKNQEDNKFYFRCKDQPGKPENERNVNVQSHELVLKGSQPLNIISVGPNQTVSGSTTTVPVDLTVRTDDGAEEGKAICYFSGTGEQDSYIAMFETNSFEHKQSLYLPVGRYKYYFRCIDLGGNTAEANTEFNVFVDKQTPKVTRAYREEGLKIVTDEDAQCVYSLTSCNYVFSEGLPMIYSNPLIKRNNFAEWKPNAVYYTKCRDLYGNEPSPNECSIVVSAIELTENSRQ